MTGGSASGMLRPSPDDDPIPVEYAATPIHERGLTVGAVVTMRDRTEHAKLTRKALHDPLTGLANRTLLDAHLRQSLARLARRPGKMVAVLFLDLDRFKVVNDSLGHTAGDEMLREVASRLQDAIRAHDTVARFGGDEFVVLCDDFRDERDIVRVSERLIRSLTAPITVADTELQVTISIGIAMTSNSDADPDDLIRDADVAMYRAKELGRNRYELFDDTLRVRAMHRLTVERDLRGALERNELRVHYQPKVSLADGSLVGVEALVRWEHPQHGLLSPDQFIPVAEETGLIGPLGAWVLEQSCRQAQEWRERYPHLRRLMLAVNLSGRQLPQPDLPEMVADVLVRTGFPPSLLCLEITESVLMADAEHADGVLEALKRLGVQLEVDDYRTAYSSLSYLTRFPI
jgi:diguanylate cyclase (GGDEF)-like protein